MIAAGSTVHSGLRGPDHVGVVLEVDDPRAWEGTLAFPGPGAPSQAAVREHVGRVEARGDTVRDKVPVAWSFGRVYWERPSAIEVVTQDWELLRVDVDSRSGLVTEGRNLAAIAANLWRPGSATSESFTWLVDVERTLAESRYDWSRAEVTPAAAARIASCRMAAALREARQHVGRVVPAKEEE